MQYCKALADYQCPILQIWQKAVYLLCIAAHIWQLSFLPRELGQPANISGARTIKDKRTIDCRFLLCYLRVYDTGTRQQIRNLVDITPGGIMVVSDYPRPEEQITRLRVELPDYVAEKPCMEFDVHSKWCEPDIIPSM
jgi:hypothetical protein